MEYLLAIILVITGIICNKNFSLTTKRIFYCIIFIYIVLVFSFRYRVGGDTIMYMNEYKQAISLQNLFTLKNLFEGRFEPAILIIYGIGKSLKCDFWFIQLILALIINTGLFIFIWRYSTNVFLGLLFYLIFLGLYYNTEILRESAAISIFLINFKNLKEKKWFYYYLFSLLSISFHYSAIIIWFFPFVTFLKPNLLFWVLCAIFVLITPVVESLNQILQFESIQNRVNTYTKYANFNNINWKIAEVIRTIVPVFTILLISKFAKLKVSFKPFILLQVLFCAGAFAIPMIFSRFINYTFPFVIIAAANMITGLSNKRILQSSVFCLLLATQIINYSNLYKRWVPYVSIFNPKINRERETIIKKSFY